MTGTVSKDAFHLFAEGVFFFERNISLYGPGEASAVHANGSASVQCSAGELYSVFYGGVFWM